MRIHILGICGTFMGGIAALAREAGHEVSGSDEGVYPPMSDMLVDLGIRVFEGYDAAHLEPRPDCVIIGNALSRGNPAVEHTLDCGLRYQSGPAWLYDNVLRDRWVLAVAGTHGKTTTASLLTWILDQAGLEPGFLVGGVPQDFCRSARLGKSPYFVIEADEYDTAFFDKRSKFIHYRPKTLVLNNLEFDHADIFSDLEAIKIQFHHLLRTIAASARIIVNEHDEALRDVISRGCWTPVEGFSAIPGLAAVWQAREVTAGQSHVFEVIHADDVVATVDWHLAGRHNIENALGGIAAAGHAGVDAGAAAAALKQFAGVRRRLETRGVVRGITVYDDFAHHPTEIAGTIAAMREKAGNQRIFAIVEPRSNSMKMGVHRAELADALQPAERVYLFRPDGLSWDLDALAQAMSPPAVVSSVIEELIALLVAELKPGDHALIMSNGGFGDIHDRLLDALRRTEQASA